MKCLRLELPPVRAELGTVMVSCALLLASVASAQGHLVVPPNADTFEGNGAEFWAASPFTARRQLVLDGAWLVPANGRSFTAVAMRRNQGTQDDCSGGRLILEVVVAHATGGPRDVTGEFAANRGPDATRVFAGLVSFPTAPLAPTTPAPWAPPYAVSIPFTVPFGYRSGPLVVETMTRTLAGPVTQNPWWPIDAVIGPTAGVTRTVGRGCFTAGPEPTAGADSRSISVGATAVFWLRGRLPSGPATCLLGGDARSYLGVPLPLDLAPIGMPSCFLYNDIVVALPTTLVALPRRSDVLATIEVQVPPNAALAGAPLFTQWLVPNAAGGALRLGMSNGVEALLGGLPSQPGAAWIEAVGPFATMGRVRHDRCPVLRLDY